MKNACWIALIATECLIYSAAHRLELSRPKDGGLVPPTFDLTFELDVEGDVRAFSRDHGDASVCISLDGEEPASCFGIFTKSPGVSDLPLGPHEMRMWVTANDDGGGELVLVPATLSAFTVLSDHAWREWLAKGGNASPGDLAAMEEEKRMVSPPLLEWWQNSRSSVQDGASPLPSPTAPPLSYYDSSRQQQQQRRHPWVCPRFVAGRGRGGGDEGNGDTNNEKGDGNGNGDDEGAYDVNLVIGIKSNAGRGFEARDALRRTWLPSPPSPSSSKSSTQSFCAWFLIGEPVSPSPSSSSLPPSSAESEPESEPETEFHSSLGAALELEQSTWGDLLLGPPLTFCPDHYLGLVCKTKAFMRFATQGLPLLKWRWLMLLDDDVYLKPHSLVEALVESAPSQRFYAGQVWAEHFGHPIQAMRLESHQNFLPTSAYPMDTLPPFAIGPHYLLSFDCAAFIGANFERLKGVGTLEDVSVALWLLAIQVHPTHIRHFLNARTFGCPHHGNTTGLDPGDQQANIVSLADLTPAGLFRVHAAATTASSEDDMCAGFKERWIKEPWRHDKRKSPTTEQQRADADDSEEENTVAVAAPAAAAEIGRQQEQQQEQGHQQEQEEQRPEENGDRREKIIIKESDHAGDDGGAATCLNGVCLEVLLPTMGSFHYSDGTGTGSVDLKVSVAKQQGDSTSSGVGTDEDEGGSSGRVEDGLLELCVCVDDGERMCARLGAGGGVKGVVSLAVDGLKVGTHRVRAALVLPTVSLLPPPPPEAAEAEAEVVLEVLFDVVPSHEVAAAQDEQQHLSQQQLLLETAASSATYSSNTHDSSSSLIKIP